jgi:NAD(P)-dependent dehydrogenase (short-subunit alcohol dehydrogenase family)
LYDRRGRKRDHARDAAVRHAADWLLSQNVDTVYIGDLTEADITNSSHVAAVVEEAGSVVAITSRSVREVIDDLVLSNAVRRAVIGMVKTVSREFAPDVRTNAVLPGAHETGRIEDSVDRGEYPDYEAG